jgi:hypothetical protein
MNIIKYLIYLLIVFSVVKNYQKNMINNNVLIFITIIIVIGFMITDSFFKPNMKEGFAEHISCKHYYDDYGSEEEYGGGMVSLLDPDGNGKAIYNMTENPSCGKGKFCRKRRSNETGGTSFGICQKTRNYGHKCALDTWCKSYYCSSKGKCKLW